MQLFGAGFIVTADEASALGYGSTPDLESVIRGYRNGRDLTDAPRGVRVIDAFGLSAKQLRSQLPAVYQWLLERVKPERDQNNRATYRDNWWLFGETNPKLRKQLATLPRYIATVETSKHRTFQFLDSSVLPDNKLIAIALADTFSLGVLSSRTHVDWSLAAGSWLGVGNDPVYVKTRCFEAFPFPSEDTGLTPDLQTRIAHLAEQIDAHRKRVLGQSGAGGADLASAAPLRPQPPPAAPAPASPKPQTKADKLTLTGLYNVLEALREGRELTAKEKTIHTQGLVGILKELHDELDAAVLQAYGWADLQATAADTPELLMRLVALNARRSAEEKTGLIRWLRSEFQNPAPTQLLSNSEQYNNIARGLQADLSLDDPAKASTAPATPANTTPTTSTPQAWPANLPEQVRAVAQLLANANSALALSALESSFKGRGPWKKSLPRILGTLEALGRARREDQGWRG